MNEWERLWNDFLKAIAREFPRGGNGSGETKNVTPSRDPQWGRLWLTVLGVLLLVIAGFTSYYTVDVSEEAVVTRFGKYVETAPSGLHFKFPFGIDSVTKIPSKVTLLLEFGFRSEGQRGARTAYSKESYADESLMLTGDLNVAQVEWILKYRIRDAWKYLFHAKDVEQAIRDVSVSIMRRVVGDRRVGEVLTVARVEVADAAKQLTQEVLDRYDMGIKIDEVILQDVNPPDSVKPAFNEVNAAMQEQEQTINNAEREYNMIIPEARGKAEQLISEAEAYSLQAINQGKGDAAKFASVLVEYRKAPDVTRRRLYLETMEDIFSRVDRVTVVDPKIKGILPVYEAMRSAEPTKQEGAKP